MDDYISEVIFMVAISSLGICLSSLIWVLFRGSFLIFLFDYENAIQEASKTCFKSFAAQLQVLLISNSKTGFTFIFDREQLLCTYKLQNTTKVGYHKSHVFYSF